MKEPIRILSDIHFGHPHTLVHDWEQLRPLIAGAGTMIFNGDSVEQCFPSRRDRAGQDARDLQALCRSEGAEPVLITGNHDPEISDTHFVELGGGEILVTHGDMLFCGVSPWSRMVDALIRAHHAEIARLDEVQRTDLEYQLRAAKRVEFAVPVVEPRGRRSLTEHLAGLLRECWPPSRPAAVLRVWLEMPGRAARLAETYRPKARFVAVGHVHNAGVWEIPPRWVINTGSFCPPFRRRLVEIEGDTLTVRAISSSNASFFPGKVLARLSLNGEGE